MGKLNPADGYSARWRMLIIGTPAGPANMGRQVTSGQDWEGTSTDGLCEFCIRFPTHVFWIPRLLFYSRRRDGSAEDTELGVKWLALSSK